MSGVPSLAELFENTKDTLRHTTDEQLRLVVSKVIETQREDRRENQILYYRPVSPQACKAHRSQAQTIGIGGGNGSSKTEVMLAEIVMLCTGMFSEQLDNTTFAAMRAKFRGPLKVRIVVESLTTTLYPIILPKLQWWQWSGVDEPGGDRGHWGWIPRRCLRDGVWVKSWQDKLRLLTMVCYDPDDHSRILGESQIQFCSHDQDPSDFASGDFHIAAHDEPPTYAIWRENQARTMRVGGRMMLAMTWPDDPSIPVDWIYDLVYEPGRPGKDKSADIDWFEFYTEDNPNLRQEAVAKQAAQWSDEIRAVRLRGQPIRFSSRVHPLFTDQPSSWCVECNQVKFSNAGCERCQGRADALVGFCHVSDFAIIPGLPTIFLLDPHPRKPHMGLWVQVDQWDDCWAAAEMVEPGGAEEVAATVARVEREFGFHITKRVGDRNMLHSPSGAQRDVEWSDEFRAVGLRFDDSDVSDVGRTRFNDYLKVDRDRRSPRFHVHSRCATCIKQIKRFVWDDYKHPEQHDQKQAPKTKDDDFPGLIRYLLNTEPRYKALLGGGRVLKVR